MGWREFHADRNEAADSAAHRNGEDEAAAAIGGLATFRELYRSRDGRMTVFEDAHGHITAVDSKRLVQPE